MTPLRGHMSIKDGQLGPTPLAAASSALGDFLLFFSVHTPLSAVRTSGGPTRGFVVASLARGPKVPPDPSGPLTPPGRRREGLRTARGHLGQGASPCPSCLTASGPPCFFFCPLGPWAVQRAWHSAPCARVLGPFGAHPGGTLSPLGSPVCRPRPNRTCIYKLKSTCKCTTTRRLRR